jgi:DHA1 family tetracycline resistance protein-like MFS transporter
MNKKSTGLLFSVVFMDMVGFGFIIPILPDIVADLGSSTTALGLILASYALGQFIAAPVVGRLSDRFGRKPLLLISIFGTFVSLIMLGTARSIAMIFASRILDGLTGGNITVAQSYIGDVTEEKDRAKGLGLIGAAFGLGFILGPLFGGLLVSFSLYAPALVAAGIAAVNLLLITILLPESLPADQRAVAADGGSRGGGGFRELLSAEGISRLLSILFFYSLAFSIFQTMFSPHAMEVFALSPQNRAYILAYVGVIIALTQGVLISRFLKRFSETQLIIGADILMAVSLAFWGANRSIIGLLVAMVPLAVAGGLLGVVLRSRISQAAGRERMGVAMGLSASVESFNRILAPALGAWLLSYLGPWAPGAIGAILLTIPLVIIAISALKTRVPAGSATNAVPSSALGEEAREGV